MLKIILKRIIESNKLHAKWLNTLSFLENCGARKIAACEHPTLVKEEILKHAAEEFRHAHHLKRQITKVSTSLETYALDSMLGGIATLHYVKGLDLKTSRFLKKLAHPSIKETAYLLVTYAIELRALELYALYDELLRQTRSCVSVKSIFMEEKEHLKEIQLELVNDPVGMSHAQHICHIERALYEKWLTAIVHSTQALIVTTG